MQSQDHLAAPFAGQDSREGSGSSVAAPSAFTPGPWWLAGKATVRHGDKSAHGWIADVHWKNREANARLIAAAPELLEACRAIAAWDEAEKNAKPFDEDGGAGFYRRIGMCQDAFNAARAAIARALGTDSGASGSPASKEQGQMTKPTWGSQ